MNVGNLLSKITSWLFVNDYGYGIVPTVLKLFSGDLFSNPVLFLFVVVLPLVGLGIGIIRRIIRFRG